MAVPHCDGEIVNSPNRNQPLFLRALSKIHSSDNITCDGRCYSLLAASPQGVSRGSLYRASASAGHESVCFCSRRSKD